MSISLKIEQKTDRLASIKDRLVELKGLIEDANEELTEEQVSEVDTLSEEEAAVVKSINSLRKIEAGLAVKAAPTSMGAPAIVSHANKSDDHDVMFKGLVSQVVAHVNRQHPLETAKMLYAGDDRVEAVVKAAVAPASTDVPAWAGALTRTGYESFLEDLRGVSVFGALRATSTNLNFGNLTSLSIPRRDISGTHGTDLAGSFVGELGVIPVKSLALTSTTLNRYRMAVISAASEDALSLATPDLEALIRRNMIADTAQAIDAALLDNSAVVAGVRPAGLMNNVTATPSAGVTSADIITDIKVLLNAMTTANLGARPVLVMNSARLLGLATITNAVGQFAFRSEISSGTLLGVPVITSSYCPAGTVFAIDAESFVSAQSAPEFKVSDQTVLTMANASGVAPTQAGAATNFTGGAIGTAEQVKPRGGIIVGGDAAGAPTGASVAGYQAMSMYQQAAVAIRMQVGLSWGSMRSGTVAAISGVAW